ncbi:MAG: ATP-binding cassette domain-containing protein, partial [Bacteroidetes bacterium]
DLLYGVRELKLAQGSTQARWEWERVRNEQFHLQQALDKDRRRHTLWLELVQGMRDVVLIGLTAHALIRNELTVGALLAVVWIVSQLPWASRQLAQFFADRARLQRWFERVQEVWELPAESDDDLRRDPLPEKQVLVLEDVTFGWKTGLEGHVLEAASMRVEPGTTTLVIGSSGSGKSTLIQLLAGLFPPDEGEIRYGTVNLAHVAPELWRARCSVLLQGGHLFQDTIASNIALGDPRPDMGRLRQVAQAVRLLDWIDALPLAFQTVVGHGGLGLSRGQIQQLLLARLIYREAEIYLMDEPLFGLDGPLAREVLENLLRFLRGKTIVIAAPHELAGLDADVSYLLTKGALRMLEKRSSVKH